MDRQIKLIIGISLGALFVIAIGFYAYRQSREYLSGPIVTIIEPSDGTTFTEAPITITGNAQNISYISLNDGVIFVDSKGTFREKILLMPGYNLLSVKAQDRFGRKIEKTLQLVYTAPQKIPEGLATSTPLTN